MAALHDTRDSYRELRELVVEYKLSADNLRYLADKEGIHVCQGNKHATGAC